MYVEVPVELLRMSPVGSDREANVDLCNGGVKLRGCLRGGIELGGSPSSGSKKSRSLTGSELTLTFPPLTQSDCCIGVEVDGCKKNDMQNGESDSEAHPLNKMLDQGLK